MLDLTESATRARGPPRQVLYGPHFPAVQAEIRWSVFSEMGGEEMFQVVRDDLFPFFRGGECAASPSAST
jgi:hypothetical protein